MVAPRLNSPPPSPPPSVAAAGWLVALPSPLKSDGALDAGAGWLVEVAPRPENREGAVVAAEEVCWDVLMRSNRPPAGGATDEVAGWRPPRPRLPKRPVVGGAEVPEVLEVLPNNDGPDCPDVVAGLLPNGGAEVPPVFPPRLENMAAAMELPGARGMWWRARGAWCCRAGEVQQDIAFFDRHELQSTALELQAPPRPRRA